MGNDVWRKYLQLNPSVTDNDDDDVYMSTIEIEPHSLLLFQVEDFKKKKWVFVVFHSNFTAYSDQFIVQVQYYWWVGYYYYYSICMQQPSFVLLFRSCLCFGENKTTIEPLSIIRLSQVVRIGSSVSAPSYSKWQGTRFKCCLLLPHYTAATWDKLKPATWVLTQLLTIVIAVAKYSACSRMQFPLPMTFETNKIMM